MQTSWKSNSMTVLLRIRLNDCTNSWRNQLTSARTWGYTWCNHRTEINKKIYRIGAVMHTKGKVIKNNASTEHDLIVIFPTIAKSTMMSSWPRAASSPPQSVSSPCTRPCWSTQSVLLWEKINLKFNNTSPADKLAFVGPLNRDSLREQTAAQAHCYSIIHRNKIQILY